VAGRSLSRGAALGRAGADTPRVARPGDGRRRRGALRRGTDTTGGALQGHAPHWPEVATWATCRRGSWCWRMSRAAAWRDRPSSRPAPRSRGPAEARGAPARCQRWRVASAAACDPRARGPPRRRKRRPSAPARGPRRARRGTASRPAGVAAACSKSNRVTGRRTSSLLAVSSPLETASSCSAELLRDKGLARGDGASGCSSSVSATLCDTTASDVEAISEASLLSSRLRGRSGAAQAMAAAPAARLAQHLRAKCRGPSSPVKRKRVVPHGRFRQAPGTGAGGVVVPSSARARAATRACGPPPPFDMEQTCNPANHRGGCAHKAGHVLVQQRRTRRANAGVLRRSTHMQCT